MRFFAYCVTLLLLPLQAEQFSGRTPTMGQSWHSGGARLVTLYGVLNGRKLIIVRHSHLSRRELI